MNKLQQNLPKTPTKPLKVRLPPPRQRKFVDRYLEIGNKTQAFIDAGYSKNGAQPSSCALLSKPIVKAYYEHRQAEIVASHKDIFDSIVVRVNNATLKAERGRPVYDSKGAPVMRNGEQVYLDDTANALKGHELLAKLGGLADRPNNGEERPAFVGISINMGDNPSVQIDGEAVKDREIIDIPPSTQGER